MVEDTDIDFISFFLLVLTIAVIGAYAYTWYELQTVKAVMRTLFEIYLHDHPSTAFTIMEALQAERKQHRRRNTRRN